MATNPSAHQKLEKTYRSVPLTPELKKALATHVKKYLSIEDAGIALNINRRQTLADVIKNGSCHSSTYNKLLVLVTPQENNKSE